MNSAAFTGSEQLRMHDESVELARNNPHKIMPFFFTGMGAETYIDEVLPAQVVVVQGQSSNGKSLILNQQAEFLASRLPVDNQAACVVFVDTEKGIESHVASVYWRHGVTMRQLVEKTADPAKVEAARNEINDSRVLRIASSFMKGVAVRPHRM